MNKRVVVITGASSGLGKELAKIYAQNGDILVLSGRNADELNQFKTENVSIVTGDLTNNETLEGITNIIAKKIKG